MDVFRGCVGLISDLDIGTMTVHPHGDESLRAQELGASIFVSANRNMMKAAKVSAHHDGLQSRVQTLMPIAFSPPDHRS